MLILIKLGANRNDFRSRGFRIFCFSKNSHSSLNLRLGTTRRCGNLAPSVPPRYLPDDRVPPIFPHPPPYPLPLCPRTPSRHLSGLGRCLKRLSASLWSGAIVSSQYLSDLGALEGAKIRTGWGQENTSPIKFQRTASIRVPAAPTDNSAVNRYIKISRRMDTNCIGCCVIHGGDDQIAIWCSADLCGVIVNVQAPLLTIYQAIRCGVSSWGHNS